MRKVKIEEVPRDRTSFKIKTKFFVDVELGKRNFDVRLNDRDYRINDLIVLHEVKESLSGLQETGKRVSREITSLMYGGTYGIVKGYVIMSIK